MRILHLIGSTGWYGAESVVSMLTTALPSMGIDSCVGHLRYARKDVFRFEERMTEGEVFPVLQRGRWDMSLAGRLNREIKRRGIDVIHAHGYKPDFYGGLCGKLGGIPLISTCHLWTRSTPALKTYANIDTLVLRRFDKVVAVSRPILDELAASGIEPKKLSMIPNGIQLSRFLAVDPLYRHLFPKNSFIFGAACRQVKAKGIDLLLRAIPRVAALVPDARFLIAGDGPNLNEYREQVKQLALGNKVLFLGHCEAIPEFHASLDVFLLPSRDEGLPIALLEAMASARAVIATNVGSVNSLVINQETGLLIPPDDLEALSAAMLSMACNRDRIPQFGSNARRQVSMNFSSQSMVRKYAELYQQMAAA